MPKDAPVNVGAPPKPIVGPYRRVSEMQAKLHRWAAADPGRRFDDLFNFVCDPATLLVAFDRVAGNQGANTPGVEGLTAAHVEEVVGVPGFLDDLRTGLKDGSFRPLPVRERKIPKPGGSGKLRKLGIPTIADRVVQAALKLVLEPVFEADFEPVSYGFRPKRRAQDAIAEIHQYGTQGYRWVLDADIEACFDSISHSALLDRMRLRVKDKRVLGLVKAFLKAGVLTEFGDREDTHTGTPQGGIWSSRSTTLPPPLPSCTPVPSSGTNADAPAPISMPRSVARPLRSTNCHPASFCGVVAQFPSTTTSCPGSAPAGLISARSRYTADPVGVTGVGGPTGAISDDNGFASDRGLPLPSVGMHCV
jgi:retron-type reverse transcriptase